MQIFDGEDALSRRRGSGCSRGRHWDVGSVEERPGTEWLEKRAGWTPEPEIQTRNPTQRGEGFTRRLAKGRVAAEQQLVRSSHSSGPGFVAQIRNQAIFK